MSNERVLAIYGAGGLGREVLELACAINERTNRWEHFVFIDDGDVPDIVSGCNVYAYNDAKKTFGKNMEIVLGVGEPAIRGVLCDKIESDGYRLPTLIHPDVHIPRSTTVGKGVVIQYGCFISCDVVIEDRVYIQPQCNIGHDDVLKKGCMISGLSNLGGAVIVGENTYIGLGTAVRELVQIGDNTIIGMMSAVHRNIENGVVAMGNPARVMAKNDEYRVFKR